MAINTHKANYIEYIQDSNDNKHYLNAEYLDGHSYDDIKPSAANHYTPAADSSAQLSVDASSTTAATWDKTALVTGVNLQRDSKGHVTGVTVDSIKMPANPNTHQAIKTLKTDNTAPQPINAGEAIAGSGTINLHKVAKTGSYGDLNDVPTNLVTTDTEQTVTGTKHFNAITANTIGTGSDANNYFQSQKFRGEGDANTYYHAVDFGYAGHNQVDFYEYGGNYNFYINTQANTDSRQLLFGINPSGIKIPPAAGAKVLGTNAEGQVESHSLGIADISSLQSTLDGKVNSSSLATVAKTGSYNDLSNKPTIPDISNLVPYLGAISDVNLGNHSLLISDTTSATGVMVNVSGKQKTENDTSVTIKPGQIELTGIRRTTATLASSTISVADDNGTYRSDFSKGGLKAQRRMDTDGDGQLNVTYYSSYVYDGIVNNGNKLSFPEKAGTIALTDDISTLLDKGTSSTVVNQVVYNPVEMKKVLKVPSIQGENSANNTSNGAPMYILGGTMATEGGQATGSASLHLFGYTGATGNPYDTTLTQTASGIFRIAPGARPSDTLIWADG